MIKFNEVTWYSKLLAAIFLLGVFPALTFYIGMQYEAATEAYEHSIEPIFVLTSHPASSDISESPAKEEVILPTKIGECLVKKVKSLRDRLEGAPELGNVIEYENGGVQVSQEAIPAMQHVQIGDRVTFCLVSIPENCPVGDERGKEYSAKNMRTGESWTEIDSNHMCGGA